MAQDLKFYFDLIENFNKKYNDLLDAYEVFKNKPSIKNKAFIDGLYQMHALIKPFESFMDQVQMICALYLDKVISENVFKVFKPTIQGIIDDKIIDKVHTALDIPCKQEYYAIIEEALK